jgi:hypothetical protein
MKLEFSGKSLEKYSNKNFMKIPPVEADLLHVKEQTD